jgi:hypothetical protein
MGGGGAALCGSNTGGNADASTGNIPDESMPWPRGCMTLVSLGKLKTGAVMELIVFACNAWSCSLWCIPVKYGMTPMFLLDGSLYLGRFIMQTLLAQIPQTED